MSHAKMLMAALVAGCVWLVSPVRAADPQQTQPPAPSAPSGRAASSVSWLTGYRFHLDAASVRSDDPRFHWDAHFGATIEGGMRLYGSGAGVELFAAWERRVDPYPLERATRSWLLFGFRFINR
jgi:hypothetical protein